MTWDQPMNKVYDLFNLVVLATVDPRNPWIIITQQEFFMMINALDLNYRNSVRYEVGYQQIQYRGVLLDYDKFTYARGRLSRAFIQKS